MDGKQIGNILRTSHQLHGQLLKAIRQQAQRQKDPRLSTALKYMEEVEQKSCDTLDRALANQSPHVLETFIRYYSDDQAKKTHRLVDGCAGQDTLGLMNIMLKLREQLAEIYDFCSQDAHLPEVTELMTSLRDFERRQLRSLGRQMNDYPFEALQQQ